MGEWWPLMQLLNKKYLSVLVFSSNFSTSRVTVDAIIIVVVHVSCSFIHFRHIPN